MEVLLARRPHSVRISESQLERRPFLLRTWEALKVLLVRRPFLLRPLEVLHVSRLFGMWVLEVQLVGRIALLWFS